MKIAVAGATGRVGHHVADILTARGHDVVPISRHHGVDVITGEGLAASLVGVDAIVDATTGPSPEQQAATEFFTTATRNLHAEGERAGVRRLVMVSIIGTGRSTGGYGAAKIAHEAATLSGPVPARIVRAAQFHELVAQLVEWGTQGEVAYVPTMRTQLVAARTVAESVADVVTGAGWEPTPESTGGPIAEIAGPREENLAEMAGLLIARRGDVVKVEEVGDATDSDAVLAATGGLLPSPHATLAGPTFAEWLESTSTGG